MAKIKYSAIGITNMSGKSGGSVFAFNRAGAYVRRWAKPTNPMTDLQTATRQAFGALSRAYGSLTDAQVSAWKTWGIENPRVDRLGESRPMLPMQAFMSANANRKTIGLGSIDEPLSVYTAIPFFVPQDLSVEFEEGTGVLDSAVFTLLVDDRLTPPLAGLYAVVSIAKASGMSKRGFGSVVNEYKFPVATAITALSTNVSISTQVAQAGIVPGDKVYIKVELYNTAGQKSEGVTLSTDAIEA